jgi:hypothetical protein
MKVRFIYGSPEDGSLDHEDFAITDDLETPARDFIRSGFEVRGDIVRDIDFPSSFPINNMFSR